MALWLGAGALGELQLGFGRGGGYIEMRCVDEKLPSFLARIDILKFGLSANLGGGIHVCIAFGTENSLDGVTSEGLDLSVAVGPKLSKKMVDFAQSLEMLYDLYIDSSEANEQMAAKTREVTEQLGLKEGHFQCLPLPVFTWGVGWSLGLSRTRFHSQLPLKAFPPVFFQDKTGNLRFLNVLSAGKYFVGFREVDHEGGDEYSATPVAIPELRAVAEDYRYPLYPHGAAGRRALGTNGLSLVTHRGTPYDEDTDVELLPVYHQRDNGRWRECFKPDTSEQWAGAIVAVRQHDRTEIVAPQKETELHGQWEGLHQGDWSSYTLNFREAKLWRSGNRLFGIYWYWADEKNKIYGELNAVDLKADLPGDRIAAQYSFWESTMQWGHGILWLRKDGLLEGCYAYGNDPPKKGKNNWIARCTSRDLPRLAVDKKLAAIAPINKCFYHTKAVHTHLQGKKFPYNELRWQHGGPAKPANSNNMRATFYEVTGRISRNTGTLKYMGLSKRCVTQMEHAWKRGRFLVQFLEGEFHWQIEREEGTSPQGFARIRMIGDGRAILEWWEPDDIYAPLDSHPHASRNRCLLREPPGFGRTLLEKSVNLYDWVFG